MADNDVDVDDLLEAPFKENEKDDSGGDKRRSRDEADDDRKDGRHKRSDSRTRKRSRSKERKRSRSPHRDRKQRSRSPRRRDRRGGDRDRNNDRPWGNRRWSPRRSPPRRRGWSPGVTAGGRRLPGPERRDVMPFTPRKSPPRNARERNYTQEERDARTVFIMQLAARTRPRDMEEFFSSVGNVRDVRIITDSKTRRSKGIAYVEFWDLEAVPLALGLNGQRLLGAPLIVQHTMAEKNRAAAGTVGGPMGFPQQQLSGPMKLYIGSLHFNITEEMLKGIFEPFGRVEGIQLMVDESGRSRGYGFVTYRNADDAKRAMEQLNGFELAGRPIKVGHVTEHQPQAGVHRSLDSDELDRTGVDLGTAGRLQLMAKLAEGTGLNLPKNAKQVLSHTQQQLEQHTTPAIATQCFMLSNMFDPTQESDPGWDQEIKDDVIEECSKNGGVLHIFVDKESAQGNVYVKCPSVASAVAAVNSLHGRWFAGKVITANYVPVSNYHSLFADAVGNVTPLMPGYKTMPPQSGSASNIY